MYRDKTTGQYPISKQELVSSNPNISLPAAWTDEVLEILGVDYVKPVAKPEITSIQRLVEGAPEQREDGGWYQTWVIQDFTEEEISNLIIQKKIEKKSSVEVKRDALLKTGYTFTFEEQILTLQTRDDEDRINRKRLLNAIEQLQRIKPNLVGFLMVKSQQPMTDYRYYEQQHEYNKTAEQKANAKTKRRGLNLVPVSS